jgi:hypothetical protein
MVIAQIIVLWHHIVMLADMDVSEEHFASIFGPEEAGSMFPQNICIYLQDCTLSQSRTAQSKN